MSEDVHAKLTARFDQMAASSRDDKVRVEVSEMDMIHLALMALIGSNVAIGIVSEEHFEQSIAKAREIVRLWMASAPLGMSQEALSVVLAQMSCVCLTMIVTRFGEFIPMDLNDEDDASRECRR